MGTFKFTYDDDNLKEIKVVCVVDGDKKSEDLLETVRIFCIDTIPSDLNPTVEETDDGFKISCEDEETGKEVLAHIFRYVYIVTMMAMTFKEEFSKGSDIKVDELDFSKLRPYIVKTESMDYKGLAKLIGEEIEV